jgi:hypothetical protein
MRDPHAEKKTEGIVVNGFYSFIIREKKTKNNLDW